VSTCASVDGACPDCGDGSGVRGLSRTAAILISGGGLSHHEFCVFPKLRSGQKLRSFGDLSDVARSGFPQYWTRSWRH
jgi:hypothetical protein